MHIYLFLQAWKARHVLQNLKNPYIIYADSGEENTSTETKQSRLGMI